MNHAEEKAMEMEALAAIFGDQFETKSPDSCTILATPNADTVHLSCFLDFSLPPTYPEVLPALTIRTVKGMNDGWMNEVSTKLMDSAKEVIGGPMLFSLVELARDWLTERNVAGVGEGSMYSQMIAKEHEKQRHLDQQQQQSTVMKPSQSNTGINKKKQETTGTPVTAESFLKWMTAYVKEEIIVKARTEPASKMTGRQLFEKGNLKVEEEEVVAGDVEDFDRSLFADADEVDLDMLSDDEEDEQEEEEQ